MVNFKQSLKADITEGLKIKTESDLAGNYPGMNTARLNLTRQTIRYDFCYLNHETNLYPRRT